MTNVEIVHCTATPAEDGRFRVDVHVANRGERPVFVPVGLNHVDVDREADRIVLRWAAAPERKVAFEPGERREVSVPATRPIDPGADIALVAEASEDLEGVPEVAVVVAVGEAPFYFNPTGEGSIEDQFRLWGTEVTALATMRPFED